MLKVSAYCRVSTEQDDQLNSLENQKRYFIDYINKNPEWQFCGLYIDEGISGTNINKRKGFKNMLKDAENKKFDLLLTKEISRFARNTLDSIMYTRQLKSMGIGVIFLNDNISTLDNDGEFRLTIMASMAQEESRKTSERVKWGLKRAMENGVVLGWHCYGYHLVGGKLTVNEEEAAIVRLIFNLYLDGYGTLKISKLLEEKGYRSPAGSYSWAKVEILRMLKNEKYVGVLKQKKEITIDYLSHKRVTNDGQEDFIILENNHEPIVDIDTWNNVQTALAKRKRLVDDNRKYSNRYCWSSKIVCGLCGKTFTRRHWNGKQEKSNVVWQCQNNVRYGGKKTINGVEMGCSCKGVHETVLQDAFISTLNDVIGNKKEIAQSLKKTVNDVLTNYSDDTNRLAKLKSDIEKIELKKLKVLEVYVEGAISRGQFDDTNRVYQGQLERLDKERKELEFQLQQKDTLNERLNTINRVIDSLSELEQFSDAVCTEVLSKVEIYSRDKICFFLNIKENSNLSIPVLVQPYPLLFPIALVSMMRYYIRGRLYTAGYECPCGG